MGSIANELEVHRVAMQQEKLAMGRYNARYDNHLYFKATNGKGTRYANALIDEALAICGSPYSKLSRRKWCKNATEFLKLFAA